MRTALIAVNFWVRSLVEAKPGWIISRILTSVATSVLQLCKALVNISSRLGMLSIMSYTAKDAL